MKAAPTSTSTATASSNGGKSSGTSNGNGNGNADKSASENQPQKPQQQQPILVMTRAERQREQALKEVEQVMNSLGSTRTQLDHFNLLGVVANPRGGMSSSHGSAMPTSPSSSAMSSAHGPNNSAGANDAASYTYQSLESTLSSVTGQIEALNSVFEDWSRHYLNDYYNSYSGDASGGGGGAGSFVDTIPESQLQELPPELTHLDLANVQVYLRKSGSLAQTFHQQHQRQLENLQKQQQQQQQQTTMLAAAGQGSSTTTPSSNNDTANAVIAQTISSSPSNDDNDDPEMDLVGIPDIFFQNDFDLTDPQTFRALLLTNDDGSSRNISSSASTNANNTSSLHAALTETTHDLFHIPPPDHFTGHLDKVEVALLEQVREKSEAFFQETNRFAQLKEWVGELLLGVQQIRGLLQGQSRAIQSWQQVPAWDRKRKQLVQLEHILEGSSDILRCKQCIGGLLSAKDDLGAVEQIQYARKLLAGTMTTTTTISSSSNSSSDGGNSENIDNSNADGNSQTTPEAQQQQSQHSAAAESEQDSPIELGRLQALRTVGEQLNQYENLVVTSLTEEVVEIFLEWNTSALASIYGPSSGSNGGSGGAPSSMRAASQQEIQRRTINIVQSLKLCSALSHMAKFYSTRLHDMVRMTVRTTVGEFASDASSSTSSKGSGTSVSISVTAMSLERFIDCLDMLFEQLLALATSAAGVDEFCQNEGLVLKDATTTTTAKTNGGAGKGGSNNNVAADGNGASSSDKDSAIRAIIASAAELSSKSLAELLRLRKEVHALVSLDEMRRIWETCMKYIEEVEKLSGHKCVALRTMLLTQAKAFVERKHDSNMTALAAALDSERWTQCEVSSERQVALTRLCTGRAGVVSRSRLNRTNSVDDGLTSSTKSPEAEVEGIRYKVVWSCLLLVEMVMTNIEAAACFQNLASIVVGKVSDLLRLFNSRATQLVLGAGAIHSAAKLKSINAKHLSLVTQCLGMIIAILPHIRASLSNQLPQKQHTLLTNLDKIKREFADHNEKVLNKFVTIIGGIVEHGLAKHIGGTDFDARAKQDAPSSQEGAAACCVFLEGVLTNTRKMHQVLSALLPPEHLQDVFSRIFAFIDQKIPALLIAATESSPNSKIATFSFPTTNDGKKRLLDEVTSMTKNLNALAGVFPWEFSAVSVLAKTLEYEIPPASSAKDSAPQEDDVGESEAGDGISTVGESAVDCEQTTDAVEGEASGADSASQEAVVENAAGEEKAALDENVAEGEQASGAVEDESAAGAVPQIKDGESAVANGEKIANTEEGIIAQAEPERDAGVLRSEETTGEAQSENDTSSRRDEPTAQEEQDEVIAE